MTLNDFFKRVKDCSMDSMIIFEDENGGWTNVNVRIDGSQIKIFADRKPLFSDD